MTVVIKMMCGIMMPKQGAWLKQACWIC